jgi:hypothetical protein
MKIKSNAELLAAYQLEKINKRVKRKEGIKEALKMGANIVGLILVCGVVIAIIVSVITLTYGTIVRNNSIWTELDKTNKKLHKLEQQTFNYSNRTIKLK